MSTVHKKQISIVIVTYNSSKHIGKLLKSLIGEMAIIREIIIIENNSLDKKSTKRVVSTFIKLHKNIKIEYIEKATNNGFAKSCNEGAWISSGKYLLFINPDTEIKEKSLRTLLDHAIQNESDIAGGIVENFSGGKHHTIIRSPNLNVGLFEFSNLGKMLGISKWHDFFYYEDNSSTLNPSKDKVVDAIGGAYLLVKKLSFEKLKGFDERFFMYLEDVDLGVRANKLGMIVMYCPHSVIMHEGGASSKNKYRIRHQAWYDSRKNYYLKHFGLITNVIIQPLFYVEEKLLKLLRPQ